VAVNCILAKPKQRVDNTMILDTSEEQELDTKQAVGDQTR